MLPCRLQSFRIACIDMAGYAEARIVRQDAIDPRRHFGTAVGYRDLSCMQGIANTDTATVMKGNPAGAGCGIKKSIEDWPIRDGIATVLHRFSFAIG